MRAEPSKLYSVTPLSSEASAQRHRLCSHPTADASCSTWEACSLLSCPRLSLSTLRLCISLGWQHSGAGFLHTAASGVLASQLQQKECPLLESYSDSSGPAPMLASIPAARYMWCFEWPVLEQELRGRAGSVRFWQKQSNWVLGGRCGKGNSAAALQPEKGKQMHPVNTPHVSLSDLLGPHPSCFHCSCQPHLVSLSLPPSLHLLGSISSWLFLLHNFQAFMSSVYFLPGASSRLCLLHCCFLFTISQCSSLKVYLTGFFSI